ncbi:MAG: transposase, partial [Balneolaceae bacterium]
MRSVIVGIDVSRERLDAVVLSGGEYHEYVEMKNTTKELSKWLKALRRKLSFEAEDWLVCVEHTGLYCDHVIEVTSELGIGLWIEDASRIKAFHSLSRGKNDKLDATRIAEYAYLKQGEALLWAPPREVVIELKSLNQLRRRLLTSKHRLSVPLGEEEFMGSQWSGDHRKFLSPILRELDKQLKEVEGRIMELIRGDEELHSLYEQVTSVKGVGLVVAVSMLVMTNEFKWIRDPRKMACHCGVAPFEYSSGKSIRGRNR